MAYHIRMLAGMYGNKVLQRYTITHAQTVFTLPIVIHRVEHALATKSIKHNIHAYVQL